MKKGPHNMDTTLTNRSHNPKNAAGACANLEWRTERASTKLKNRFKRLEWILFRYNRTLCERGKVGCVFLREYGRRSVIHLESPIFAT
jgi:hypothetical protein